jgi:hypothetical protein
MQENISIKNVTGVLHFNHGVGNNIHFSYFIFKCQRLQEEMLLAPGLVSVLTTQFFYSYL